MNRGNEVRQALMQSAIRVVSAQGISNATTKALSNDSGLSEVYIYRYFESKDDLLKQTFDTLDKELMFVMKESWSKIDASKNDGVNLGFKAVFHDFWRFTLSNKDKCSFFIQYYYSSYYSNNFEEKRKAIYQPLLDVMEPVFAQDADAWVELNHMYDIAFPKIQRVLRGTLPNNEETERSVYLELRTVEEKKILWEKSIG